MNAGRDNSQEDYRAFLLLSEIEKEENLSQRDLAQRLGIALGLVNSYLKNLVAKGFVRVRAFPRNRYAYLLTPKGLAEKSRLAYRHLSYFTNLYTTTRQDYLDVFRGLHELGVRVVAFCGVDEVAEIAYLSLQEADVELGGVMDECSDGRMLFRHPVQDLAGGIASAPDQIVITSLKREEALHRGLLGLGVARDRIHRIGDALMVRKFLERSDD